MMKQAAAILAALMLVACSQEAAPPAASAPAQADAPALLEDFAEEEISAAAPVEAVPFEPEPLAPLQPEFSFDNPPPEADQ